VLGEHLNKFVMIYLDNIIIYSDLEEEHEKHIKWVLEKLHNKKHTCYNKEMQVPH